MAATHTSKTVASPRHRWWHALLLITIAVAAYYNQIIFQRGHFWDDYANCVGPKIMFNAVKLNAGELPLWCSEMHCGFPNVDGYHPHWTYAGVLHLPLFVRDGKLHSYWLDLTMLLHVVLLGFFTYLYLRRHMVQFWLAAVGGAATCLSGQFVFSLVWVCVVMGFCWLPLVLLFLDKFFDEGGWRNLVWAGFFTGVLSLAGHSQWTTYAYQFIAGYAILQGIVALVQQRRPRLLGKAAIALLVLFTLAFATAAVRIVPELELTGMSQKLSGVDWRTGPQWRALANAIFPHAFGKIEGPGKGVLSYWGDLKYADIFGFWSYWDLGMYAGIIPLVVFFIYLPFRKPRAVWALQLILILAILFAYGNDNPLRVAIISAVPPLKLFRQHFRMATIFASFILPIVCACALDRLTKLAPERRKALVAPRRLWAYAAAGVAVLIALVILNARLKAGAPGPAEARIVQTDLFACVLMLVAGGGIVGAFLAGVLDLKRMALALLIVFWLDLYLATGTLHFSTQSFEQVYAPTQVEQILTRARDEMGIQNQFRSAWNGHQANLKAVYHGIDSYNGYVSAWVAKWIKTQNYANRSNRVEKLYDLYNVRFDINAAAKNQRLDDRSARMTPRVYPVHEVDTLDYPDVLPHILSNGFDARVKAFTADAVSVEPLSDGAEDRVRIDTYRDTVREVQVTMASRGLLVFSEHMYPGWRAYVDGKRVPVQTVNGVLCGVVVPAGAHDVRMEFVPVSVFSALAVSAATWAGVGIVFVLAVRRG